MKLFRNGAGHIKCIAAASLFVASMLNCTTSAQSVDAGTVQVSSIGHTFSPATTAGGPVVKDFFIDQQQSSGGGGIVGSVSANFDVDNQFVLTITAPPGQKFLIHVPTPGTVQFGGSLGWSSSDGFYSYFQGSISASFGGLVGNAPTFGNAGSRIAQNHDAFGFNTLNSSFLSGDITFSSITLIGTALTQTVGTGTISFSPSVAAGNIFYAEYFPSSGQSTDPGRFVSIISVPEPRCTVLFFLGILLLIVIRLRSPRITRRED